MNELLRGAGFNVVEGPFFPHEAPCARCGCVVKYLSTDAEPRQGEVLCEICDPPPEED